MGCHRMRRITDHDGAAAIPRRGQHQCLQRAEIHLRRRDHLVADRVDERPVSAQSIAQDLMQTSGILRCRSRIVLEQEQVHRLAAERNEAQWIASETQVRTGGDTRIARAHEPPDALTGVGRLHPLAEHELAHGRVQSIAAHYQVELLGLAIAEAHTDRIGSIVDRADGRVVTHLHAVTNRVHREQIGQDTARDPRCGRIVRAEHLGKRPIAHLVARAIERARPVVPEAGAQHLIEQAEQLERAQRRTLQDDADPRDPHLGFALDDPHPNARARQADRKRQAGDSGTDDQYIANRRHRMQESFSPPVAIESAACPMPIGGLSDAPEHPAARSAPARSMRCSALRPLRAAPNCRRRHPCRRRTRSCRRTGS